MMSEHPVLLRSMYVLRAHTQIRDAEELLLKAQGNLASAQLYAELDRLITSKTDFHQLGTDVYAHLEVLTIDSAAAAQARRDRALGL